MIHKGKMIGKKVCPTVITRELLGSVLRGHGHLAPTPDDFLDIGGDIAYVLERLEGCVTRNCYGNCDGPPCIPATEKTQVTLVGDLCPATLWDKLRGTVDEELDERKVTTIWDLNKIRNKFEEQLRLAKCKRVKKLSELDESLEVVKGYKLFSGRMSDEEMDQM